MKTVSQVLFLARYSVFVFCYNSGSSTSFVPPRHKPPNKRFRLLLHGACAAVLSADFHFYNECGFAFFFVITFAERSGCHLHDTALGGDFQVLVAGKILGQVAFFSTFKQSFSGCLYFLRSFFWTVGVTVQYCLVYCGDVNFSLLLPHFSFLGSIGFGFSRRFLCSQFSSFTIAGHFAQLLSGLLPIYLV